MISVVRRTPHRRLIHVFAAAGTAILLLSALVQAGVTPVANSGSGKQSNNDGPISRQMYVQGQVVVKLTSDTVSMESMALGVDARVQKHLVGLNTYLLEIDPGDNPVSTAVTLEENPKVEYAHPNYVINPLHPVQGSYPFSDEQLQGDFRDQPPTRTLKLATTHPVTTGAGVTVAVIDGGVDYNHPELAGKVTSGWDYIDDDPDARDVAGGIASGHGTFVAGIVNLVAPEAQIRAYRVMSETGFGDGYSLAAAIQQAVLDGCDIINLSVVLMAEHQAVHDVIEYARSQGVTVVVAAGNEGTEQMAFPATDPGTIAVTAIDSMNILADFSSYGSQVDVCAPGTWIYSTYQNNGYAWWSGTSFAAPFVTGQAALLKALYPTATDVQIANAISGSALDLDILNPTTAGLIGSGLVDPGAAIALYASMDYADVLPDTLYFVAWENDDVLRFKSALIITDNGSAPYSVEVIPDGEEFASIATSRSGMSNDSVTVQVNSSLMPLGTHYNTIRFTVAGVTDPVDLVVALTVEQPAGASITPDTIVFIGPSGILTFAPVIEVAYLTSVNAPATYTAEVVETSGRFVDLNVTALPGLTNDSVEVYLNTGVSLPEGAYYNHVNFLVEGVPDPVVLTVVWNVTADTSSEPPVSDSVWVEPNQITFMVDVNEMSQAPIYSDVQMVYVRSINEPVPYYARTLDDVNFFAWIDDTAGNTGDSVPVYITVGSSFTEGVYYNTIELTAEGISQKTYLTVQMVVLDDTSSTNSGSVSILPTERTFHVNANEPFNINGAFMIENANGPSAYMVSVVEPNDFVTLASTSGLTGDSVTFTVSSATGLAEGLYVDQLAFLVENSEYETTPIYANLYLSVMTDTAVGESGAVWTDPDSIIVDYDYGSLALLGPVMAHVYSTNQPAAFVGWVSSTGPVFASLWDSLGTTGDSVLINVLTTGLNPGTYYNDVHFDVNGIAEPGLLVVQLNIIDTTGGVYGSATLKGSEYFEIPVGSLGLYSDVLLVNSTNAPAAFTANVISSTGFAQLSKADGTTPESVDVFISANGLAGGLYHDTIEVTILGVENNPFLVPLTLAVIDTTSDSVSSLTATNYPNPFNPETNISFSLPRATRVTLNIYNVLGQKVRTLVDGEYTAGEHTVVWDGSTDYSTKVASGAYFYRLQAGDEVVTKKMMMLK